MSARRQSPQHILAFDPVQTAATIDLEVRLPIGVEFNDTIYASRGFEMAPEMILRNTASQSSQQSKGTGCQVEYLSGRQPELRFQLVKITGIWQPLPVANLVDQAQSLTWVESMSELFKRDKIHESIGSNSEKDLRALVLIGSRPSPPNV